MKLACFIVLGCLATVAFARPSQEELKRELSTLEELASVAVEQISARGTDKMIDADANANPEERNANAEAAEQQVALKDEDAFPGVKLDERNAMLEQLDKDAVEELQARMAAAEDLEDKGMDNVNGVELDLRSLNPEQLDEKALEQLRARFAEFGEENDAESNLEARNALMNLAEGEQFDKLVRNLKLDDLEAAGDKINDKRTLENVDEMLGKELMAELAEQNANQERGLQDVDGAQMNDKRSLEELNEMLGKQLLSDLAEQNANGERELQDLPEELDDNKREQGDLEEVELDKDKLAALEKMLEQRDMGELPQFIREAKAKLNEDLVEQQMKDV